MATARTRRGTVSVPPQPPPNPVNALIESRDVDIHVLSGPIYRPLCDLLIDQVHTSHGERRPNALLFLCTYGGDADAAYLAARCLRECYDHVTVAVFGVCKSAGTLIALGAHEVIMAPHGELGPLDVQVPKDDEIVVRGSGLDISRALDVLHVKVYQLWEDYFLSITGSSRGAITSRTAADIASRLAVGLVEPIAAQIEPLKLGEIQRSLDIAREYGVRLGARQDVVHKLVEGYPSHGFVIDFDEASALLGNVRRPTDVETEAAAHITFDLIEDSPGSLPCLRYPKSSPGIVAKIRPRTEIPDAQQLSHPQLLNTDGHKEPHLTATI